MDKQAETLSEQNLIGKRINFEGDRQQTLTIDKQIVIFNKRIGGRLSNCFLGTIKPNTLIAIKKRVNLQAQSNITAYNQFKSKVMNQIKNANQAEKRFKKAGPSHIAKVYPILCIKTSHCYVLTEYYFQGSLEQEIYFRKTTALWFTFQEVLNIIRQIMQGYRCIYDSGLLHQNINPANIYLSEEGYLMIGNFGQSTKIEERRVARGNVPYCAPQKYESGYQQTTKSDVFSIGVTLFQLLYGKHPYFHNKITNSVVKNNIENIREAIKNNVLKIEKKNCLVRLKNEREEQFVQKLNTLVQKMLQKQVKHRISPYEIEAFLLSLTKQTGVGISPLKFLFQKMAPQIQYSIQLQTKILKLSLKSQAFQASTQTKNHDLFKIGYQAQRINILTLLLESLHESLDMQIEQNSIQSRDVLQFSEVLLLCIFHFAYIKYHQILASLLMISQQENQQYMKSGIPFLVNISKDNFQFILNKLSQRKTVAQDNPFEGLNLEGSKISFESIFIKMKGYIEKWIKNKNLILHKQFASLQIIAFLAKFFRQFKPPFSIEQLEDQRQNEKKLLTEFKKLNIGQQKNNLQNNGFRFVLTQLNDDQ